MYLAEYVLGVMDMTELERCSHRVCITGHRPEKLLRSSFLVKQELEVQILRAYADGLYVYISGMSRGVDIWAAETVIAMRNAGYSVQLICACPYPGFASGWHPQWQERYQNILQVADYVQYINTSYSASCFQTRNEWMVNHAARVIAVYNGEKSGTKNTIDYAIRKGVPIVYIDG